MKILLTGGAGYIGSTLTPFLLAAGHQVRVLDYLAYGGQSLLCVWTHPGFEFIRGDIRDREIVRTAVADRMQSFTWRQLWAIRLAPATPT